MHSMTNSGMNLSVMPGNQVSLRWAVGNSRQGSSFRKNADLMPIRRSRGLAALVGRKVLATTSFNE